MSRRGTWLFLSTPSARRATALYHTDVLRLKLFLSTPSARRATKLFHNALSFFGYFYPRPPRGGRHFDGVLDVLHTDISIHALREEGDLCMPCACWLCPKFLSTPSARRATYYYYNKLYIIGYFYPRPPRGGRRFFELSVKLSDDISIHALREEGDHCQVERMGSSTTFLSTPSARRATNEGVSD